jgi:hypothetical protein
LAEARQQVALTGQALVDYAALIQRNSLRINTQQIAVVSGLAVVTVTNAQSPYAAAAMVGTVLFLVAAGVAADTVFDLPPATGSLGIFIVKKSDANARNIAITPNGTDTIDGVNAAVNISVQNDGIELVDAATGAWQIKP